MRTRSTILGFATLIILLTAGAAQSLSGSNTVFSDDIVDGAVTTTDIRQDAVTSSRIITGGVLGSDIHDGAVTGADVADGSLLPTDIAKISGSTVRDFGAIAAHACRENSFDVGVEPAGKVVVVIPSEEFDDNGALAFSAMDSNVSHFVTIVACNVTDAVIDPLSSTFTWMVFNS